MTQHGRRKQFSLFEWLINILQQLNLWVLCGVFASVLLMWGTTLWWRQSNFSQYFKFHHIKVAIVSKHIVPDVIAQKISDNINGGFFTLNTRTLCNILKQDPWIKDVRFRRVWPDILEATVIEQTPIASWNEQSLINTDGKIFMPSARTFPSELLRLNGPNSRVNEVLDALVKLQRLLQPCGAKITALKLNSRDAWQMEVNNQVIVMLGHKDIDAAVKKFVVLYSKVIALNESNILSIDMRYPNGAAIAYKAKKH